MGHFSVEIYAPLGSNLNGNQQPLSGPMPAHPFKVIDGHEGGARGYLRAELGLDDLRIARLKALYTE